MFDINTAIDTSSSIHLNISIMKIIFVIAACLVAASEGVFDLPSRRIGQGIQSNPKRCCLPNHWQGYIGESISSESRSGTMAFVFDYAVKSDENMNAFRMLDRSTFQEMSRIVLDFNTNMMYNITGGDCVKSVKPPWFEASVKCLPPNAEYIGDFLVGGVEDNWVATYWRVHNITKHIKYTEIAFSKNCYPIAESLIFDAGGSPMRVLANFANTANKITTPEIFDVPASCKNNVPKEIAGEPLHHPKSRFT